MNYRKLYEKHYGIQIPKGFVIHHIDCDRNNNDISNLIMLPNELHQRFHWYFTQIQSVKTGDAAKNYLKNAQASMYDGNVYMGFGRVIIELARWIEHKNFMDYNKELQCNIR